MLSTIQVSSVVTAMQSGFSLALLEALGVLTVQTIYLGLLSLVLHWVSL